LFWAIVENRGVQWWRSGYYEQPAWSPDGRKILYLYGSRAADTAELMIMDGTSPLPELLQTIDIPANRLTTPSWRSNTEISVFDEELRIDDEPASLGSTGWIAEPARLYLYNLNRIPGKSWKPRFLSRRPSVGTLMVAKHSSHFEIGHLLRRQPCNLPSTSSQPLLNNSRYGGRPNGPVRLAGHRMAALLHTLII
jgi:hypothetical protein